MAIHPVGDSIKVKVDPANPYGGDRAGIETGVVVEVPDSILYLGFHNFAFEASYDSEKNSDVVKFFKDFVGKRAYWQLFQDRGRRLKEGKEEFIYLKMTDIMAIADSVDDEATVIADTRSGGYAL